MFRFINAAVLAAALYAIQASAFAGDLTGTIRVVDGDTIWLDDTKIRLFGIDAPERGQKCTKDGAPWDCGDWATETLRSRFDGATATCEDLGDGGYGRTAGRCWVNGEDIAALMVQSGAAFAYERYSKLYVDAEKAAIFNGAGVWQGDFDDPEAYRAAMRTNTGAGDGAPDGDCVIKGNISRSGHIYHVPGQNDYLDTVISKHKGERWFCTEAEAIAAGWRAAKR